jgi:NAD(P)H-hydrate repair Nnr-like enzyme with NAD(P)H-hydrate dehydratase domain
VVDADGLKYLPKQLPENWLLTPHAGELARLLGEQRSWVTDDPVRAVLAGVEKTGATVLLKGATTLVVAADGRVRSQADAPHWMATAGSGDVLAGLAGALLAAGLEPLDAGAVAAAVHGRAGYRASGGGPLAAEDVLAALGPTVVDLLRADGC